MIDEQNDLFTLKIFNMIKEGRVKKPDFAQQKL